MEYNIFYVMRELLGRTLNILGALLLLSTPVASIYAADCAWQPSGDMACGHFRPDHKADKDLKPVTRDPSSSLSRYKSDKPMIMPIEVQKQLSNGSAQYYPGTLIQTQSLIQVFAQVEAFDSCRRDMAVKALETQIEAIYNAHPGDLQAQIIALDALSVADKNGKNSFLGAKITC
ncbi:MAG: hypothetical protein KDJ35_00080 [Alphaproteobacteria bacterium]|nr:hypothetical protein [Alphaproteobacteria bacterium]